MSAPLMPHLVEPGTLAARLGTAFSEAGHELWLVGGAVRDDLLGRPVDELDLATDARPSQVLDLLRPRAQEVWLQGMRFGTVGASIDGMRVEVTTYRQEWYTEDSRKPEVAFAPDITSDLSRRDFTVNAIAVRAPTGEVHDPFGGIQDLMRGLLRTPRSPEQAFSDDPLRMLRACRFASVLTEGPRSFFVSDEVVQATVAMADRLAIVSRERVRDELSKLLVGAKPSIGLEIMVATGLHQHVIAELGELAMEQDPIHRHKDVLRHTFAVVDKVPPDLVCRLGALLHDIGKPATRAFGPDGVTFHHHEVVGAQMAERILRDLRYPVSVIADVRQLVYLHLRFHTYAMGWTDSAVRRYVRDAGPLLQELNALVRADCTTRNKVKARKLQARMDELEERIADLAEREELSRIRPALDGYDVMALFDLRPSREVGDALDHLLERRLQDGPTDRWETYEELERWGRERGLVPARTAEEAAALADQTRPAPEEPQS
ncbi:MAG TPA: CCA tRNA nucleotidyltransferase [Actinomycetota bacterium]|nr:CCA tRNA nucleotidyltransferase [Actinomycetota bacterium]